MSQIKWNDYRQAYAKDSFGERNRKGLIRQPANSYTNLFILLASIFILLTLKQDILTIGCLPFWYLVFSFLYFLSTFFLSIASFIYHGTMTFAGEVLDNIAMRAWVTSILLSQVMRLFPHIKEPYFLVPFLAVNLLLALFGIYRHKWRRYIFSVLCSLVFIAETLILLLNLFHPQMLWYWSILLMFILTMSVWLFDQRKTLSKSGSWFQFHSFFHFLASIIIFLIFVYLRSGLTSRS